ncbi:hypothetical protein [Nodosilinea sp. P-1105]|uniref:hypothetical protein n=1 Tax=Nodosilinea sp. P-1105 TaxID=2546229 RepID=UPI00146D3ED8|nr:hypothetical protein [Nodosilinea sp. P-1105]
MDQQSSPKWVGSVLWEALTLDQDFYEDAHKDAKTERLAPVIVWLAAISHGIGSSFILVIYQPGLLKLGLGLVINTLSVVVGYYLWTYTIWQINARLKTRTPAYQELLAPVGFAYTPQVLGFLTVIPLFGPPLRLGLAGWSLLAAIVAVRQGLNLSLARAMVMAGVGFTLVQVAIGLIQLWMQAWASG